MKISVASHSLVHSRQYLFFDYLNTLEGVEVQQIYPFRWGSQQRDGGFEISGDSIGNYVFGGDAFKAIKEFFLDLLYAQAEWWSMQAYRSTRWAERLGIPHVLFTWENLRQPVQSEQKLLQKQALVICGNHEAEEIVKPYNENTVVLPQVGISSEIFKPLPIEKQHNCLFVGRWCHEKGVEYVDKLIKDGFDVLKVKGAEYTKMPLLYNSAKIHLCPSIDTPRWKEQNGPFTNIEALMCGLPVIASDSRAIVEYLEGCNSVEIVPQNDYESLKEAVLNPPSPNDGRDFVMDRYSYEAIAEKLLQCFHNL